eukprot:366329-Chlamydomonas_euryale.AAC.2
MRTAHFSYEDCMQIWATDSRQVKRGHCQAPTAYIACRRLVQRDAENLIADVVDKHNLIDKHICVIRAWICDTRVLQAVQDVTHDDGDGWIRSRTTMVILQHILTTFQMCRTFLATARMRPPFLACSTCGCAQQHGYGCGWAALRTLRCNPGIHY